MAPSPKGEEVRVLSALDRLLLLGRTNVIWKDYFVLCGAGQVQGKSWGRALFISSLGPGCWRWLELAALGREAWTSPRSLLASASSCCLTPGKNDRKSQTKLLGCQQQCSGRKTATSRVPVSSPSP